MRARRFNQGPSSCKLLSYDNLHAGSSASPPHTGDRSCCRLEQRVHVRSCSRRAVVWTFSLQAIIARRRIFEAHLRHRIGHAIAFRPNLRIVRADYEIARELKTFAVGFQSDASHAFAAVNAVLSVRHEVSAKAKLFDNLALAIEADERVATA